MCDERRHVLLRRVRGVVDPAVREEPPVPGEVPPVRRQGVRRQTSLRRQIVEEPFDLGRGLRRHPGIPPNQVAAPSIRLDSRTASIPCASATPGFVSCPPYALTP